jgi:hypothetical protein
LLSGPNSKKGKEASLRLTNTKKTSEIALSTPSTLKKLKGKLSPKYQTTNPPKKNFNNRLALAGKETNGNSKK